MNNKGFSVKRPVIRGINGIPHFLAPDERGDLALYRYPRTGDAFIVEDEKTCDPNVWALILAQFE